jgi:hypothetical protein
MHRLARRAAADAERSVWGETAMTRTAIAIFAVTAVTLMCSAPGTAEVRARHFTPEQLYEQSTLVIQGRVSGIAIVAEFEASFPVEASVDTVVKGRWPEKDIAFQHKHPGLHVIFEQEFNTPEMGQRGTFYIQKRNGSPMLIGYIRDAEPFHQASELTLVPDLISPAAGDEKRISEIGKIGVAWWVGNRGRLAEESFRVAGYFAVARPIAQFAIRDDRVWEVRVLHLHSGAPTGILWINDRTEKVIALGAEEKEETEPIAPANPASPRR